MAGLFALVSLAFLSHISTAAHLGVTLFVLALLCRWFGDRGVEGAGMANPGGHAGCRHWVRGCSTTGTSLRSTRPPCRRCGPTPQVVTAPDASGDAIPSSAQGAGPAVRPPLTMLTRSSNALGLTSVAIGWPVGALARPACGGCGETRARDRLSMLLAAWPRRIWCSSPSASCRASRRRSSDTPPSSSDASSLRPTRQPCCSARFAAAWGWRAGSVWRVAITRSACCPALSIGVRALARLVRVARDISSGPNADE